MILQRNLRSPRSGRFPCLSPFKDPEVESPLLKLGTLCISQKKFGVFMGGPPVRFRSQFSLVLGKGVGLPHAIAGSKEIMRNLDKIYDYFSSVLS